MEQRPWEKVLPRELRSMLDRLSPKELESLEELRLRAGFPMAMSIAGQEQVPESWKEKTLSEYDLRRVLEVAGKGSVHAILDQLRSGYVTAPGGVRLGICGEAAVEDGRVRAFRTVTSLAIRIPHTIPGVARPLLPTLFEDGRLLSTLIISPPGVGKTTLLRDLIRCLSVGDGVPPLRLGVADERGELGAGDLRPFLGPRTDVLENVPKAAALLMLLRGMAPQVLAADEITDPADLRAMEQAASCGAVLLATAHGADMEDLRRRPLYRRLLGSGVFRRFVLLGLENGKRTYQVWDEEGRL